MKVEQDLIMHPANGGFVVSEAFGNRILAEGPDAGCLLREAVDGLTARGGGELRLGSGVYPIDTMVELKSGILLRGTGPATSLKARVGLDSVLRVAGCDRVRICDLEVVSTEPDGAITGVDLDGCGDVQVRDCTFRHFGRYGLHLRNNAFLCEIRGCRAYGCGEAGFCLRDLREKGRIGEFVPNLLNGCVAAGGGTGFALHHALVVNLVGCQVFQSASHGFLLTRESNSVALTGCRTFQVGGNAYDATQANEICLSGNIFCWHRGHGIVLRRATWGTISGNEVIDNGVRTADGSLRNGIVLEDGCRGLQISGNAIFNWADQCPMENGIVEDNTCHENNITANTINYFTGRGIDARGKATADANNLATAQWYMWDPEKPYPDFDREALEGYLKR